ncbi:MAG: ABC transporter ATP-binding protein [Bacillota bacterium]|nr:ABC transporter ATP-binding protein [Bacillota bacterium]
MIKITNLVKSYVMGDNIVQALNNITLNIEKKEFVAIVGPSGSGKSTLMNIIGCLDTATSGSYQLNGQEISDYNDNELSEYRNKTIGFIFQKFNLLTKLSALENVELPLIYQGISSKERKEIAIEAIKSVGLYDRMNHKPVELSGGQQQRVAIARALVCKPSVILADEPTGALDSKTGMEVLGVLQELHKKGNTIVLITHDMNVAKKAKRILRIMDGKIVSDEEVEESEVYAGVQNGHEFNIIK